MTEIEIKQLVEQMIAEKLQNVFKNDRYVFDKNIQVLDGRKIQVGKTTGLTIGTEGGATGQKLGFFSATPVAEQLKADHNNWAAVSDVVSALVNLGLLDQT